MAARASLSIRTENGNGPSRGIYTADDEFINVHGRRLYDGMMQGVELRALCGTVSMSRRRQCFKLEE